MKEGNVYVALCHFVNYYYFCVSNSQCKKKHTLLCPDFAKSGSCPRGTRCKLQHRQRAKRSAPTGSTAPAKRARNKDAAKRSELEVTQHGGAQQAASNFTCSPPLCPRPRLSVVMPEAHGSQADPQTPARGPLELPSFISLSSSPEEADTPDTLQVKGTVMIRPQLTLRSFGRFQAGGTRLRFDF